MTDQYRTQEEDMYDAVDRTVLRMRVMAWAVLLCALALGGLWLTIA